MTRSEYYKSIGLSGSNIDRPDDEADEMFKDHCNQLAVLCQQFIDFCKDEKDITVEALTDDILENSCTCPVCKRRIWRKTGYENDIIVNCECGAKVHSKPFSQYRINELNNYINACIQVSEKCKS